MRRTPLSSFLLILTLRTEITSPTKVSDLLDFCPAVRAGSLGAFAIHQADIAPLLTIQINFIVAPAKLDGISDGEVDCIIEHTSLVWADVFGFAFGAESGVVEDILRDSVAQPVDTVGSHITGCDQKPLNPFGRFLGIFIQHFIESLKGESRIKRWGTGFFVGALAKLGVIQQPDGSPHLQRVCQC